MSKDTHMYMYHVVFKLNYIAIHYINRYIKRNYYHIFTIA